MIGPVQRAAGPDRASAWSTVKAVGAAFVGLRKRQDLERDSAQLHPVHILIVGFAAVFVLVAALIGLVHWVVAP